MSEALRAQAGGFTPGIRLLARLARVAEQAAQSTGISLPQYRLLVAICGRAERASKLALRLGVSRPTLTSLVDGLEGAGLLTRVPVPTDRRGIELIPTAAGVAAVERAEAAMTERLRRLAGAESGSLVADLVHRIDAALDREREEPPEAS